MGKLKVLGVCAGNGVGLFPFLGSTKFKVVGNIEPRPVYHTKEENQWKANFKNIGFSKDKLLSIEDNVDIILGNPDCGHSSKLTYSRAKKLKDPKENKSLNLFFDLINFYTPKVWLMENLEKLLDTYTREDIEKAFPRYRFKFLVSSVSAWGNSQISRERLVIVATRKDLGDIIKHFPLPDRSHKVKSSKELLKDLEGLAPKQYGFGHVREDFNKEVCMWYEGDKLTLKEVYEKWNFERGLKESKTWPGHYNTKTQPGVYKLFPNEPPKTVRKQNRQFNYNALQLTPREMARIQGIPDDFKIVLYEDEIEYWINKGRATVAKCPPYEIFKWFHFKLDKLYETIHDRTS